MTFGERLAEYIAKSGLSQKQLAEKIGVTPTRLNYWVKDKREPDVFHIKALAKALEITGDELLGTENDENEQNGNLEFTQAEIDLMIAIRDLDAPGKATVLAVLESQQQRIRDYGPLGRKITDMIPGRRIPLIQGTDEADIQINYQAKREREELEVKNVIPPIDAP